MSEAPRACDAVMTCIWLSVISVHSVNWETGEAVHSPANKGYDKKPCDQLVLYREANNSVKHK
jgi:hypothetical protein